MRALLWPVCGVVLCLLAGCAFAQDVLRGLEPVVDGLAEAAANTAANSVAAAIEDKLPSGVDPTAIAGGTAAIVMAAYAALKGMLWAYNRSPTKKPSDA